MKYGNLFTTILATPLYIFRLIRFEIKKLSFTTSETKLGEKISPQDKISDFIEVFKPTRVFFVFNLLAFIVFLSLPQGRDIILVVVEGISHFRIGPLFSLLIGVSGWSVISEFGARYKTYITDNSGKSLTGNRVNYRKQLQKFFSMMYLFLPFIAVFLGVSIVTFKSSSIFIEDDGFNWGVILPYAVVMAALLLTASFLARFYLDGKWIKKFQKKKSWAARLFKLPEGELNWLNKLYGIYNDYVFSIHKETFYTDKDPDIKNAYAGFINKLREKGYINNKQGEKEKTDFPDHFILAEESAPEDFRPPTHYTDEYKPNFNPQHFHFQKNPAGSYRWIYKNNPRFYKVLHRQVITIITFSFIMILVISFAPSAWIGSPGLVCLSFGCWQGIYTGLLYIDYRYRSRVYVSARWLVTAWFLVVSWVNKDHPIRYNEEGKQHDARPSLNQHFNAWLDSAKNKDTADFKGYNYCFMGDSAFKDSIFYPVIFITAEGGAFRTGAFTSMLLSALQDSFPQFRNHIYAYSSVSGGTVGIGFFNAVNFLEPDCKSAKNDRDYYKKITSSFFSKDLLSPVISSAFYGDVLNYFWPIQFERFDRAIALEKAWEEDYSGIFKKTEDKNVFSSSFPMCDSNTKSYTPAWFINTTEVESGLQCFVSNVKPDKILFSKERDLLDYKIRGSINYSTAIGLSTRFPFFSPSAAVRQDNQKTYHYVDGGYVENTGSKTMLEILQSLRSAILSKSVVPYVIQLKFGDEDNFKSTSFLNEVSSVFNGIYNTRAGNSATYSKLLQNFTEKELRGKFISIPLEVSSDDIPLNWVFSERSMEKLSLAVDSIMKNTKNSLNKKLFLFKATADTVIREGKYYKPE